MIKKWIKFLVTISVIATLISVCVASCSGNNTTDKSAPAGTITLTVNYKETLWEYVEAMKDEESTVIGMLYMPDPCVIQIAKDDEKAATETYYLQVKNCKTEEIAINLPVTKENIDDAWNTIVKAAELYKENSEKVAEQMDKSRSMADAIQSSVEQFLAQK